jgi:multidrug efflux pump subunit AcrA (membrane-fusion protein)
MSASFFVTAPRWCSCSSRRSCSSALTLKTDLQGAQAVDFDVLAYMAPGMALLFLMYTVSYGGRSILAERAQGTLPRGSDEVSQLARVFQKMAEQVQARQKQLKQEVARLKIEIDESKRQSQVSEIVDSEFFQELKSKARDIRRGNSEKAEGSDTGTFGR